MNRVIKVIKQYWVLIFLFISSNIFAISFNATGLNNVDINNPTSLDFGPDNRLYVSQQDGSIWAFTIQRNAAEPGNGNYSVTNSEKINVVKTGIPNHTDNGLTTTIKKRQVTGILAAGTATTPVLYVASSDNLIGGGGGINDKNLDTNSGVLSRLTWDGNTWQKVDLVRGLPRCEENHSTNGMDLFNKDGQTYILIQQGGHSNKGAPSNNFVGTPEYFLSAALLIVNVTQLEGMPIYNDPRSNTSYVYDLPTLNDPFREDITYTDNRFPYPAGHPLYFASIDVGDPFGGNDGLNQAFTEDGGPVQVFSPGYRNAYDVVVTTKGMIFTSDNGPNTGWGGLPLIYNGNGQLKGDQSNTNYNVNAGDYITNEFNESGSSGHGDPLHHVGSINDPNETYYGGHPNPIRAFPSQADIITYKSINGTWQQTSRTPFEQLIIGTGGYFNTDFTMSDFPDKPRFGEYLANAQASSKVNILDIVNSSTNGITEYTASNFEGKLKGNILTASFSGNINRYILDDNGKSLSSKEVMFSGFGAAPLDLVALPDEHLFAGTIWAATYGADNITIFEPASVVCPDVNAPTFEPQADSDGDGYTNQDEVDNGTSYCSGGSTPRDNDGDFTSDINDNDDDNDNIVDSQDVFAIDANNGMTTLLPINYPFWNNIPGTGFFGLGFTGLMLNPQGNNDYLNLFDEENISFGGAAGKASIDLVSAGDSYQLLNTQQYGFQFGINVDLSSPTFTIHTRLEAPFFGINGSSTAPIPYQAAGVFIGNGDQDNYLKVVLGYGVSAEDDIDGVEILLENNAMPASLRYDIADLLTGNAVDLYITVKPDQNTAQSYVSKDRGVTLSALGSAINLPTNFLNGYDDQGLAVGIIATANGPVPTPFSATWDFLNINIDQPGVIETNLGGSSLNFGELSPGGEAAQINLELKNLSGPESGLVTVTDIQFIGPSSELFSTIINSPINLGSGGSLTLPLTFEPSNDAGFKQANLRIVHSGSNSPLYILLTAVISEEPSAVLRINAGGPDILSTDGGPNWISDAAISSNFNINTGVVTSSELSYENRHTSIPSSVDQATYNAIFSKERWDHDAQPEMAYDIPLDNGSYTVKLYMGNSYSGTSIIGDRVYDILLENEIRYSNLDLIKLFGHQSGGMLSFDVDISDGELNIKFSHNIQNPLINGIEIYKK